MDPFSRFVDSALQLWYTLVTAGAVLYWVNRFVEKKLDELQEQLADFMKVSRLSRDMCKGLYQTNHTLMRTLRGPDEAPGEPCCRRQRLACAERRAGEVNVHSLVGECQPGWTRTHSRASRRKFLIRFKIDC